MLIESANAPIFGVDNAGRVTEWNSKASAITGYSGEEMLGSLLVEAEVVLPEFKSAMQQVISNAMSGMSNPTPTPTPTLPLHLPLTLTLTRSSRTPCPG